MYTDDEQLVGYRKTWLTKEVYELVRKEKARLKKEGRDVSMQKIINNLLIEKFGV